MNIPNRAIAGYMPSMAYNKIDISMDVEDCWNLFRKFIGQQLFGHAYATVPFLSSADYFGQLFMFIKDQSPFSISALLSALNILPPTYKIVGNMDYLINDKLCNWRPEFDVSSWDIMDGLTMAPDFRLRLASPPIFAMHKSIELTVKKARARYVTLPEPTDLHLHMNLLETLSEAKNFYLITEVVYASYIRFGFKAGFEEKFLVFDKDTPIGIKYRKFQLRKDGKIVRELPTKLKYGVRDAIWLRPTPQPIPKTKPYPNEGNRERKIRTVLTVSASDASRNKRNRIKDVTVQNFVIQGTALNRSLSDQGRPRQNYAFQDVERYSDDEDSDGNAAGIVPAVLVGLPIAGGIPREIEISGGIPMSELHREP